MMPTLVDLMPMRPELAVLAGACVLLLIDMFAKGRNRALLFPVALGSVAAAAYLVLWNGGFVGSPTSIAFNGMFLRDMVGDVLKLAILTVSAFAFVYARTYLADRKLSRGAFFRRLSLDHRVDIAPITVNKRRTFVHQMSRHPGPGPFRRRAARRSLRASHRGRACRRSTFVRIR